MNQVLTDLHNKRYEWAFHAKKEFVDQFVRLDVQKIELLHNYQKNLISTDLNILPFLNLTHCINLVKKERKQEYEENDKELEKLERMISDNKAQIDQKLNFFHMKYSELSSKIDNYNEFLNVIETIIQEIESIDSESFVKSFFKYDVSHKKASILNQHAIQLQTSVEKTIENQFAELKERAKRLDILQISYLRVPKLEPIPKIKQKIDSYWLTSSYDKAFNRLYHKALEWVEQMYQAYQDVLMPILNEVSERRDQLLNEEEALKSMQVEKIGELQNEMIEVEEKRDLLCAEHAKVDEMWKQDYEHAKQLQGYFIKHWLQYKEELQRQFLSENPKERWVVSQYLQLLQQDGENIIDSMNI